MHNSCKQEFAYVCIMHKEFFCFILRKVAPVQSTQRKVCELMPLRIGCLGRFFTGHTRELATCWRHLEAFSAFAPCSQQSSSFWLRKVVAGIKFAWQRVAEGILGGVVEGGPHLQRLKVAALHQLLALLLQ